MELVKDRRLVREPRELYEKLRDRGYCVVAVQLGEGLSEEERSLVQSWETTFKAAFAQAQAVKSDKGAYRGDQQVAVGYRREDQREFLETRLYTDGRVDPSFPEVPRYDDTVKLLFGLLSQIAECVLRSILGEIGLDPRSILDLTDLQDCLSSEPSSSSSAPTSPSSSLLRVCSYPSSDQGGREGEGGFAEIDIAFGAHTDTSFLTVAPASSVPGLEVWNRQTRSWVLVEAEDMPGLQAQKGPHLNVVVFVGEFLQVLTKTHFRALVHRVRAPSIKGSGSGSVSRVSCPFIIRGKLSALVDVGNTTKYAHGPEAVQHVADLDGVTMKLLHKMLDLKRQKTVKANEGRAAKGEPWVLTSYPDLENVDHALSQIPVIERKEFSLSSSREEGDDKGRFPWLSFVALLAAYTYSSVIKRSFHSCMGVLSAELSLSKGDLGLVSSSFSAAYGASKLLGGVLSDRMSNRALFVGGLVLGGACNVLMAHASSASALSIIWAANGLVQGASVPALQALVTQGFPKSSVSTVWAAILCGGNVGYLASPFALLPAVERWGSRKALAGCGSVGMLLGLVAALAVRDHPRLPSSTASVREGEAEQKQERDIRMRGGPHMLHALSLLAASCLTLFTLKSMADWGTMFLAEGLGLSNLAAAEVAVWSELGGIAGSFLCGLACDRFFSGDAARASGVFSALCGVSCLALLPSAAPLGVPRQATLFLAGFFVNGPKTLLPLAAARAAPRGSEGSFAGLLGLAGQAGSTVSGSGIAWLLDVWGWDFYPWALASSALLQGAVLLSFQHPASVLAPLKTKTN